MRREEIEVQITDFLRAVARDDAVGAQQSLEIAARLAVNVLVDLASIAESLRTIAANTRPK